MRKVSTETIIVRHVGWTKAWNDSQELLLFLAGHAGNGPPIVFRVATAARGNLSNDGAHAYTFDAENKISKVDAVSAYNYDGEGQRVRKLVGENMRFIYDMSGKEVAAFDGSTGALKKEYIFSFPSVTTSKIRVVINDSLTHDITRITEVEAWTGSSTANLNWLVTDQLGTPRVGKESYLLRKTRTLYSGSSFHEKLERGTGKTSVAEEIHRDIRINEKIDKRVFKYKPQLQAHDADLTR